MVSPDGGLYEESKIEYESEHRVNVSRPEPPGYVIKLLGSRPMFSDQRGNYDRVADLIEDYRASNDVTGQDALGPRPIDAEARRDYEAVTLYIRNFEFSRGPESELQIIEMVPE